MKYIDLRSDTVTMPTKAMRDAMATAEVGDDVYRDDPTTNKLEREAAIKLGKEAALFVTSGTMGNQLAIMTHTDRGDEVIVSDQAHIFIHEVGAAAVLSSVTLRQVHFDNGIFDAGRIEAAIRQDDIHEPRTSLICVENALANGRVVPVENMRSVYNVAKAHSLPVHLDGARVFNAAVALGVDVKELTSCCDSVSCCLSKGLCAPVGAVLAGSAEFVDRARKYRKLIGGGMRQNGILAAAGLIALNEMTKRLDVDHANAKYMAEKLSELEQVSLDMDSVQISMVFFKLDAPEELQRKLPELMLERGIKIGGRDGGEFRFVTSNDVDRNDIDRVIAELKALLG